MASPSSGKYTLQAKPLEPSYEVLEDNLDSEKESKDKRNIIYFFNNNVDDPDDIVNNVFEQNDNHHPAHNNVDGQDLHMADEEDRVNDNNNRNRVPEGWDSNKWKQGDCNMTWLADFTRDKSVFTGFPDDADELFLFFSLFLTEDVLQSLVNETSKYAQTFLTKMKDTLPQYSRFKQWQDNVISLKDMKVFIALKFYFGILKKQKRSFCTKNEVHQTPFQSKVMKRDYFLNIFAFLHLCYNATYIKKGQDGYDPREKTFFSVNLLPKD